MQQQARPFPENLDRPASLPRKKTVVFILSTSFAGSHYLSLMLGSHSRAMHLGEVYRLREARRPALPMLCFICGDKSSCPILSDISPGQIGQVYDIVFSRVGPTIDVLIDNSKLARGWAERFIADDRYERKYIHLIRDPRALVRRWSLGPCSLRQDLGRRWRMAREFPRLALRTLFAPAHTVLTYQWLHQNRRITDLIARHGLDASIVTYRDLATNPAAEMERMTAWAGLRFEPNQLKFWEVEHHGTQKLGYEWIKSQQTRHFDLRWQTELDSGTQTAIIGNPMVSAYLESLDLRAGDDGLTGRHIMSRTANVLSLPKAA